MDVAERLYPTGRIGTTNYILTPAEIVDAMLDMLPDDFWTPDKKILDIYTKSGRFLKEAFKKLYNSPYLADMDVAKRKNHILNEQLYGLTDDFTCLLLSECDLYGYAQYGKKNIRMVEDLQSIAKTTDKKLVIETLGKELGGQMKFDLIIGNPPYNKGADIDFVDLSYKMSSRFVCMITPAKWQSAEGRKYEGFRENIVPYMSKVVRFKDRKGIMKMDKYKKVTYYMIDKKMHK